MTDPQNQMDKQVVQESSDQPSSAGWRTQTKREMAGLSFDEQQARVAPPASPSVQLKTDSAAATSADSGPSTGGGSTTDSGRESWPPAGFSPFVAIQFSGGGSPPTPPLPAGATDVKWAAPVTSQSGATQVWYLVPADETDSNKVELSDANRRFYFPSKPDLESKAQAFETVLGAHATSHGVAMGAATAMSGKVIDILTRYTQALNPGLTDADRLQQKTNDMLGSVLGQTDKGYAGAVGDSGAVIGEAAAKGSIREKLFLSTNFAWNFGEEISTAPLTTELEEFIESLRASSADLHQSIESISENFERVGAAGGTVSWRDQSLTVNIPDADTSDDNSEQAASRQRSRDDIAEQRETRGLMSTTGRESAGGSRTSRTGGDIADQGRSTSQNQGSSQPLGGSGSDSSGNATGPGVTAREARQQLGDQALSDEEALRRIETTQLQFGEGIKRFILDETHPWVQTMRRNSLPTGAGPSGSTRGVMQARQLLGVSTPEAARAAAIGYILPINAHSLIEVLIGAEAVDGPSPVPRHFGVYLHLAPFDGKSIFADDEFWAAVEGSDREL